MSVAAFKYYQSQQELSQRVRHQIHSDVVELSKLRPWKTYQAILFNWLVVLSSIYLCYEYFNVATYLLAVLVISGRQHGLFILMHDAAHFRVSNNRKLNDWVGDYLISYPLLLKMGAYRANHMLHHRYTNTEKDPDWNRKSTHPDWQFPMSALGIVRVIGRYFYGYGVYEMSIFARMLSGCVEPYKICQTKDVVYRGLYYLFLGIIINWLNLWGEFVLFWCIPLLFLTPLVMRIRSIAEHFSLEHSHELNASRNILCPWYERAILAPHHIYLHTDHHLFPSVPFYNMPELHKRLRGIKEYKDNVYENNSYLLGLGDSLLRDLIKGPKPQVA